MSAGDFPIDADKALLTTPQVAARLGVKPPTLESWRYKGEGPKWIQVGRLVRYRTADIDAWVESNSK